MAHNYATHRKAFMQQPSKQCIICGNPYTRGERSIVWFIKSKCCSKVCGYKSEAKTKTKKTEPVKCLGCGNIIPRNRAKSPSTYMNRKFCRTECRVGRHAIYRPRNGRYVNHFGYVFMLVGPNEHRLEHQLVVEKALGRSLKPGEFVHHINGNKQDNRNSNLLVCSNSYHRWLHNEMSRRYMQEHFA